MSNVSSVRLKKTPVILDKERSILFDMNAFAEVEEAYGDIDIAMQKIEAGSIKALRLLLWAGLIHEDESLTVKQVGSMLTPKIVEEISPMIEEAIIEAMPEQAKEDIIEAKNKGKKMGNLKKTSLEKTAGIGQESTTSEQ